MSSSNFISTLVESKYMIWNVNEKKMPILPSGVGWSKCSLDDFKVDVNGSGFGIRTGHQPNGKYIIGLDFDMWVKSDGKYIQCNNTRKLYAEFEKLNEDNAGVFMSSTELNRGCLVDISKCELLIELIESDGRRKIQKDNYCLEVLTGFNMVVPPTKTICKIRGKAMQERVFLNDDKTILEIDSTSPIHDFIYKYINDCRVDNKVEKKIVKRYNKLVNHSDLIDDINDDSHKLEIDSKSIYRFLKLLSDERIKNYNNWFKIGLAIKNIVSDYNEGLKLFDKFSSLDKDSYNKSSVVYHWKVWENYKKTYDGLNLNYIFSLVNQDSPTRFYDVYVNYLIEKEDNKYNDTKGKFEKEVIKVLEPAIYLNYSKYFDKWDLVDKSEIEHKYLEKYGKSFIEKYFKDETKNVYDVYDFIPDNANTSNREDIKIFNSFTGFEINKFENPETVDCEIIKNHVNLLCNNNKDTIEFFTQWLAHLLFNTTKRIGICPIIKGEEGCGKGTIYSIISRMIGSKYCLMTASPENTIFTRFNDILHKKILVNLNEAEFGNFSKTMEAFKELITDNKYTMEEKNKSRIELNNYMWFLITTNNDKLFNISSSNRRFYFIECDNSKKNDREYFNPLYTAIDDDNVIYSYYKYLESVFDKNYNFSLKMKTTKTTYQETLEQVSKNEFYTFINEYIETNKDGFEDEIIFIKPAELLKQYKEYCRNNGDNCKETGKSIKLKMLMQDPKCWGQMRYNNENTKYFRIESTKFQQILTTKNLI